MLIGTINANTKCNSAKIDEVQLRKEDPISGQMRGFQVILNRMMRFLLGYRLTDHVPIETLLKK
jgi:hypothetical protein